MEKFNELCVAIEREWKQRVLFPREWNANDPLGGLREEVMHVLNALQEYGMIVHVCSLTICGEFV